MSLGSLNLYNSCVKNILPGKTSLNKIHKMIKDKIVIDDKKLNHSKIVAVGGTARSVLRVAKHYFDLKEDTKSISLKQVNDLTSYLLSGTKEARNLILRLAPERVHTLIPGLLIMQYIANKLNAKTIIVSKNGVREGYLFEKFIAINN